MKSRIYLSGPLFSHAEIEWSARAKAFLEKRLGDSVEVIWPHEIAEGSPKEIFQVNLQALQECDLMVAILDGAQVDDGTAWEIGYFYAHGKRVFGIRTDFRRSGEAHESSANAMIEFSCLTIARSLDQLASELERALA